MMVGEKMAAIVKVMEITGPSGSKTYTEVTNKVRFFTKDQVTNQSSPQDTYPIPIPTSGYKYSYWKAICLDLSGTFTKINNIRYYTGGSTRWSLGTNGEVRRGNRDSENHGCPEDQYQQASGTEGDTDYPIEDATNGDAYYKDQTTPTQNVEDDTESSPAVIDSTDHTSAGKTKHIVLQVKVASDATQDVQPTETLLGNTTKSKIRGGQSNVQEILESNPRKDLCYNPLAFFCIAFYKDGIILSKFGLETGKERLFKDIDQSKLEKFGWFPFSEELAEKIKTKTGQIVKHNLPYFVLKSEPEQRLIAVRRNSLTYILSDLSVKRRTTVCLLGWQKIVKGKNIKQIMYIDENGEFVLKDE